MWFFLGLIVGLSINAGPAVSMPALQEPLPLWATVAVVAAAIAATIPVAVVTLRFGVFGGVLEAERLKGEALRCVQVAQALSAKALTKL